MSDKKEKKEETKEKEIRDEKMEVDTPSASENPSDLKIEPKRLEMPSI